jgi:tRNA(Ile)-lysidine synthase
MLNKFLSYINENQLFKSRQKILLAVSGGIDSTVMTDLFAKASVHFAIAHCNFKLRGKESDEDQLFVNELAEKHKAKFYSVEFNTTEYAQTEGISIQMAARDLRYYWFKMLAAQEGYDHIAVAHNRDDVAETMLINLIRGTGLKGLTGIKPVHEQLIRPLLFASRSEIEEYAAAEKIAYREDSSNNETKYYRNLIRNVIIPQMKKINPSLNETLTMEAEIFTSIYVHYKKELDQICKTITVENSEHLVLSIPKIQALRLTPPVLYDILTPFGFSYSDVTNIMNSLQTTPGKKFVSAKYILIKDRNTLLIEKISHNTENGQFEITSGINELSVPVSLSLHRFKMDNNFRMPGSPESVVFDCDKLSFPLTIRKWKEGDFFIPLGMKGRKKLSDFFIDRKVNMLKKKKVWLLLSGEDIIWIIGYQTDDRYKITPETKNVLQVSLKN